jgi:hypothetical protein
MWITGRAAARELWGLVGSDEQARVLLRSGVCGPGLRTGGVVLYEKDRVLEVADRPFVDLGRLAATCPHGLYVGRLARSLEVDTGLPWEQLSAQVREFPAIPWLTHGLLMVRASVTGRLPWVATLSGFVVHGADLIGVTDRDDGIPEFVLEPPGPWFEHLERRWFPTSPGGRSWRVWYPPPP